MFKENVSMKSMNEKTVEVLREIHHECEGVYTEFDKLNKLIGTNEQVPLDKETLQNTLAFVASTFSSLDEYLQWYNSVEVEYASESDRETELKIELEQEKARSNAVEDAMGELRKERADAFRLSLGSQKKLSERDAQIEEKNKQIAEKDKTIANLRKQLEMEKQRADTAISKIDVLAEQNKAVLSLVEENAKTLAFHKRIRESKGSKSPNYIEGIDNSQLVKDYIAHGYKLSGEVADKYTSAYGITYGALRLRLINAGVWKAKN